MSTRLCVKTDEAVVLRDGRPFGEPGVFGGTGVTWPLPQTLAGMVRTAVGFARDPHYFDVGENCDAIRRVALRRILTGVRIGGVYRPVVALPADWLVTDAKEGGLEFTHHSYEALSDGCGTDIRNPEWLVPLPQTLEKPSAAAPFFLHWEFFERYVKGARGTSGPVAPADAGLGAPVTQARIHNGLDAATHTTSQGRLFANHCLYLSVVRRGDGGRGPLPLTIAFDVEGPARDERFEGTAYLGGERKTVALGPAEMPFPECPDVFGGGRFLKLVLLTHGDFGSWCPPWLRPDLDAEHIEWVTAPGTSLRVRLRSAFVRGWEGVSGWDYAAPGSGKPKAMRKLVRAGSVYVLEIGEGTDPRAVAKHFWGATLCDDDSQGARDGYGLTVVANATAQVRI